MKKVVFTILPILLFSGMLWSHLPSGFAQFEVADGLNPTDLAATPDGRIFITEKDGIVRVIEHDILLPDPFLILQVNDFNEQGLGHIAIDPDFESNGFIYLYYTVEDGTHNRLSRFTADGNLVVQGSEMILYEFDERNASVHNGGAITFGNDGKIYVSTGDSGKAWLVQNLDADNGKVIRLNKDGSIPDDNPFYQSTTGKYRAIYALGLRNPFSMTTDPLTGRIFVCDVGSYVWEEINDILPGKNYGYPLVEGKSNDPGLPANYQNPFLSYNHDTGCSVLGAAFYRPDSTNWPSVYSGKFYFADYCKGYIGRLNPVTGVWSANFVDGIARPVAILTTKDGGFYYLARAGLGGGSELDNTISNNGSLWKVVYTGSDAPFIYGHPKGDLYSVGDSLKMEVYSVGLPPLYYEWQRNGEEIPGATDAVLQVPDLALADSGTLYRCIVYNEFGTDTSNAALLRVTSNHRPELTLLSPSPDFYYSGGAAISFEGSATDFEEGILPDSSLTWKINFHHDEHFHPALTTVQGIHEGTYNVATTGEVDDNVWYRLYFSAADSTGLKTTIYKDILPQKTDFTVLTQPSGVHVDVDGIAGESPFVFQGVAGLERSVLVPDVIVREDSVLLFQEWSNGHSTNEFHFVTPATEPVILTGQYAVFPRGEGIGLYGQYLGLDADETQYMTRIDTTIQFAWQIESPDSATVPFDGFKVRWTGRVIPFFDDTISFHTYSDDGARLWVNHQLLVDEWHGQPYTEHTGRLFLKGGQQYPIQMEFLEIEGVATAELWWSGSRLPRAIIPKSQLYPPKAYFPNTVQGSVWIDEDGYGFYDPGEKMLPSTTILLVDQDHPGVSKITSTDSTGHYTIGEIAAGNYLMYVVPPGGYGELMPGYGLNREGYSLPLALEGEDRIAADYCFVRPSSRNTRGAPGTSWYLFPNPAGNEITFRKNYAGYTQNIDIDVYSATGKLVFSTTSEQGTRDTVLSLENLPAGVYILVADGYVTPFIHQ